MAGVPYANVPPWQPAQGPWFLQPGGQMPLQSQPQAQAVPFQFLGGAMRQPAQVGSNYSPYGINFWNSSKGAAAQQAYEAQRALQEHGGTVGGTLSGIIGFGKGLAGFLTPAGGLAAGADIAGTLGTFLGTKLMNSILGDASSKAEGATKAATEAANAMLESVASNKSAMLQNTNAMGQQGQAAAMEAQRRMNSQMVSGDAVADKNRLLANAASAQSGAAQNAAMLMRQSQLSQQNLKDIVKNMASGSATSKLGNIAALGQQSAASNLQAFQQAQQAQQQANQQALAATAAASDIYSKDLASNFERNVKPALNQWENFQQMGSSLAGQAVGQTMSSYHDNSNAIFNMLQNTENNLASASASARAYEDYINYAPQEGVMMYLTGNILG